MIKLLLMFILTIPVLTQAGWFAHRSEAYLQSSRHIGNNVYECTYRTNPGNRGWRSFSTHTNAGCYRFVLFDANTGRVYLPN